MTFTKAPWTKLRRLQQELHPSHTINQLALDEKYIGADLPGFFGVLHTWGRQLPYHPHIHYVVPGGGFSKSDGRWHPSRIDFFLPVKAMSKIFAAKFRDEIKKNGLLANIPQQVWQQPWIVNCQATCNSMHSVKYLAPYVFKVAISNPATGGTFSESQTERSISNIVKTTATAGEPRP